MFTFIRTLPSTINTVKSLFSENHKFLSNLRFCSQQMFSKLKYRSGTGTVLLLSDLPCHFRFALQVDRNQVCFKKNFDIKEDSMWLKGLLICFQSDTA